VVLGVGVEREQEGSVNAVDGHGLVVRKFEVVGEVLGACWSKEADQTPMATRLKIWHI
jgi:hypothetical protein